MVLIACVDDGMGMLFHHRRQSQDRVLREDILRTAAGRPLWMNAYSAGQFAPDAAIHAAEDCLERAGEGEFCFVENLDVQPYAGRMEKVILYHWNRRYPADLRWTLPLDAPEWKRTELREFAGSSHEKITKEVYIHEASV